MAPGLNIIRFTISAKKYACRAVRTTCLLTAASAVVGLSGGTLALAQSGTSDANPGQIERRIDDAPPQQAPTEGRGPELPAIPEIEEDDGDSFILAAVSLLGVETLDAEDLAPAYEDFLAKAITTSDAAGIANRITEIYREKGYVLSRAFVPPQTVEGGVLFMQIAEGFVSEVAFSGIEDLPTDLNPYVTRVLEERPLTLATLERAILLINDMSGIRVARSSLGRARRRIWRVCPVPRDLI